LDLDDLQRLAEVYGVDPVALLLAPNDHKLALQLSAAMRVLQAAPAETGERWLAIGADLAGVELPE